MFFNIAEPSRATVGAVGEPGRRVFYLQARQGTELMTLKLEKQQVLFLAGGLAEVLADLATPAEVPATGDLELEQPAEAEWAVGSIQLMYDTANDRVVLVAREVALPDDPGPGDPGPGDPELSDPELSDPRLGYMDDLDQEGEAARPDAAALSGPVGGSDAVRGLTPGPGVARVLLTRAQAAAIVERGKELLARGRPPCPLCGYPLTEDHSCPKTNGHKAPAL
ncbi:MAG TPA: DUF3090 family protein [Acidimicrobiales bacterium]|nr:DUF3090 family protein [Acidimicrobiales bacterium]